MSNTFLIVGRSFSGLENAIRRRGDDFIVLQDSRLGKQNTPELNIDFSDEAALNRAVDGIEGHVNGVVWSYENYVRPAAYIAERLSLPGLSLEAAERCTDKFYMRQAFQNAPRMISPGFAVINGEEDLLTFAESHAYPLIIKPANLTKSLLVSKNHNEQELVKNYRKTLAIIDSVYERYAKGITPKLVVEEFLEGPVHSVDGFIDQAGQPHILHHIVDYQTGYDIGYDDNFHYSRLLPSKLSIAKQKTLLDVAAMGVQTLGMTSSAAHIEIIYTKAGPRIVEIGARNGGYRERMHRLSNGLELLDINLEIALGHKPDIRPTRNEPCAVLELFPRQKGIFRSVAGEDKLRNLDSLVYYQTKQPVGQLVGKSSDGYKMCAIIILHNKDPQVFAHDLEFVNKNVYIQTDLSG